MAIKLTGLSSGLDTEALVKQLTSAYNTKKDDIWKQQKMLEFQQEAWTSLNADIYEFYKDSLFDAKLPSHYSTSELTSSNPNVAGVSGKISGIQQLEVKQVATQTHITGGKFANEPIGFAGSIVVQMCGEDKQIDLTADMTGNQVAKKLSEVGLEANFDKVNGRLFLASKMAGLASSFTITGDTELLNAIGLGDAAVKREGQDAIVELNGAEFTFGSNEFSINNINFSIKGKGSTTLGMEQNGSVYDKVKSFISKYNEVIKKMDTAYNADACTLEPLTDEERYAISDKQADDWDKKIKDSALRRNDELGSLSTLFKNIMGKTISYKGEKYSLYSFGIKTGNYLTTNKNDRGILNIDDEALKNAIAEDSDKVVEVVSNLAKELYDKLSTKMKSSSMKSAYTIYNDKQMKSKYNDYNKKLEAWTEKITKIEDKYFKQFSKMETMMATLQAQQTQLTGLFGL